MISPAAAVTARQDRILKFRKRMQSKNMFVQLMAVASESPEIGTHLIRILQQAPFHRQFMLATLLEDLRLCGAQPQFMECTGFLRDKAAASTATGLLRRSRQ